MNHPAAALSWRNEPARLKASAELNIHLNTPGHSGDGLPATTPYTLTGHVHRQAKAVSPRACVSIALIGRSIVRLRRETGSADNKTTHFYKSHFYLLDHHRHILFDGPLHIPPDSPQGQSWPFSIPIPTHTSPSIPPDQDPKCTFSPWTVTPGASTPGPPPGPLPPSFRTHTGTLSSMVDAWVEYFLAADLTEEHSGKGKVTAKARLPVTILPPRASTPHYGHGFRLPAGVDVQNDMEMMIFPHRSTHTVTTQRLRPGMEDASLSFAQGVKKLFKTPSVPRYTFQVLVQLPEGVSISMDALAGRGAAAGATPHVPVWIKTVHRPGNDGGGNMNDAPLEGKEKQKGPQMRTVILTSVEIRIIAITEVAVDGAFVRDSDRQRESEIMRLTIDSQQQPRGVLPVHVPGDDREDGEGLPLDVGALLGLRFGRDWVEVLGERRPMEARWGVASEGLCPDFVTYNIRRGYRIVVKMELELAREKVKVRCEQGVAVVNGDWGVAGREWVRGWYGVV